MILERKPTAYPAAVAAQAALSGLLKMGIFFFFLFRDPERRDMNNRDFMSNPENDPAVSMGISRFQQRDFRISRRGMSKSECHLFRD